MFVINNMNYRPKTDNVKLKQTYILCIYMHFADKKKFCYSHAHIKARGTVQDQIRKRPQEKHGAFFLILFQALV